MLKFVWISLMTTLLTVAASAESSVSYTKLPDAKERESSTKFVRQESFGMKLMEDGVMPEKALRYLVEDRKVPGDELDDLAELAKGLIQLEVRDLYFEPETTKLLDDGVISLGLMVSVGYIEGLTSQGTIELRGHMNVEILKSGNLELKFVEFYDSQLLEIVGRRADQVIEFFGGEPNFIKGRGGDFAAKVAGTMIKAHFSDLETLTALLEGDYDAQAELP